MQTRGRVGHVLVGVALGAGSLPPRGAVVEREGARVGEITSARVAVDRSDRARDRAKRIRGIGTELAIEGRSARTVGLPFVPRPRLP